MHAACHALDLHAQQAATHAEELICAITSAERYYIMCTDFRLIGFTVYRISSKSPTSNRDPLE